MNSSTDVECNKESANHDKEQRQQAAEHKYPCFIAIPWSLPYYLSARGAENFHLCLWIGKDLCWTQDNYVGSMIFGISALAWCGLLFYNAISVKAWEEVYNLVAVTMWLSANFLWMIDEVEYQNDDETAILKVAIVMETAIAWILLYHVVLKPLGVFPENDVANARYETVGLKCRFSFFSWRQYEHLHTLCWLGKDLSWNRLNKISWPICFLPTVLIAFDFIWTTFNTKFLMVDTVHYFAQLMWVMGNGLWAIGNIYITENDDDRAYYLFNDTFHAREKLRWWSSVLLFAAYFPLFCLYCVWIPLTLTGTIDASLDPDRDEGGSDGRLTGGASNDENGKAQGVSLVPLPTVQEAIAVESTNSNPLHTSSDH